MNKRNKILKEFIKNGKLTRLVGAHNGLTARIVERHGFEGIWASGFEISASHAVPDANILSMKDFLETASDMVNTVAIPVVVDCDTGFGNSNNVMHMVRRFEAVGVSGVCIEDKLFPKVNSFIAGRQELAPVAEFVGKIMAAKNAQQNSDFMVFARTEALIAGLGMDEALRRANAYIEAGADGVFIHSKLRTPEEIIKFCKAFSKRAPVLISPTTYPCLSEKEMGVLGINVVIYANYGIRAAVKSINETFSHISKFGTGDIDSKVASMTEVFELQGMNLMKENEKKYLKSDSPDTKAIILAAGDKIDSSLKDLLADRPVGVLDINGKSLLQRNIETLNNAKIQNITVVTGYKRENVNIDGAKIIENPYFKTKGILYSLMLGMNSQFNSRTLIIYSDILFDQNLIHNVIKTEADIVLVVDNTYKKTHIRNKKLELVTTKYASNSIRSLDINRKNPIIKISRDIPEQNANFEFAGIMALSRKGMDIFSKEYKKIKPASLTEFIQCLINKKYEVTAYETSSGWMEVHNFSDYKNAVSLYSA